MKLAQIKLVIETDATIPEGMLDKISGVCGDILDDTVTYVRGYLENSAAEIPQRYLKRLKVSSSVV